MSSSPHKKPSLRTVYAVVLIVGVCAGTGWLFLHRRAAAPARPTALDSSETSDAALAVSEAAAVASEESAGAAGESAQVMSAESWNFPEPDVVLQFEWYHVDKTCPRLQPEPEPTPMLRQIALRAKFKPCFVCSRGDEERPIDERHAIPEAFLGEMAGSPPTASGADAADAATVLPDE